MRIPSRKETMIFVKPTSYKNVMMRSKTEARAAQWLEGFGWSWIYEPEAFVSEGIQYTPDFYIPDIDAMVEVKPFDYLHEINRVLPLIEKFKKTFFIISPFEKEFRIIDLFGRLDPCDGSRTEDGWGWASQHDSGDNISIDTKGGRFPCHMIYMGSGCGNSNYLGDCFCTR